MNIVISKEQGYRIAYENDESEAVKIAISNLRTDLEKVLGYAADEGKNLDAFVIRIGTLGIWKEAALYLKNAGLCKEDGSFHKEGYCLYGKKGELVIAGADRRGTIYGIYELCERIGVSPWYFWADVPVKMKNEICFSEGLLVADYPSVEYRGIFINDEEELEAWVQKHMGEETIGIKTYEKIFELLLRLKGNYIWPAMHVNSFNMKKENGALAERMGIVVGTSHCDMLMRSNNREWRPWLEKKGYQDAEYDYSKPDRNREILKEYWRESVEQNRDFEVCYTLGMRGIHDSGFQTAGLEGLSEEEQKKAKIALLETIIHDQRQILKETLGRETMMTFVPYKEVLPLYDAGLQVPEDMTLVWANDNYGYVRRYPSEKEKQRKGGNGIYYHNSYWSAPSMSYVFLCSIPLVHTRHELLKAYHEGIRKLWVLNVGAMKPLELEISFFLRLAWEAGRSGASTDDVDSFAANWIDRQFEGGIGEETARLFNDFSQLTNVRKLENMSQDAFSQTAYGDEAAVRIHEYERLFQEGNRIYEKLPKEEKDAFFQLVLMRIHAGYFTNLQYYYGDRSTLMVKRGWHKAASEYAENCRTMDDLRRRMILYYNKTMAGGKWDGILNPEGFPPPRAAMMAVYTPPLKDSDWLEADSMPAVGSRLQACCRPESNRMAVELWNEGEELVFTKPGGKWIEIGNRGQGSFCFQIEAPEWIRLSQTEGTVETENRILLTVKTLPENRTGSILIRNVTDGEEAEVRVRTVYCRQLLPEHVSVEEDGMVYIEADRASSADFRVIARLGRCEGSLTEAYREDTNDAMRNASQGRSPLVYPVYLLSEGDCLLEIHRFPSLNSVGRIRIGVALDDLPVQVAESFSNDEWRGSWKTNVLNNVDRLYLELHGVKPGVHRLKLYAIDNYFAFSRLVLYTKERKENNLAGIRGSQELPAGFSAAAWADAFYGPTELKPRPVAYARPETIPDTLAVTDTIKQAEAWGNKVESAFYLKMGCGPIEEQGGAIRIDAAKALAGSRYAYAESGCSGVFEKSFGKWSYCGSESYGRSGLAMYYKAEGGEGSVLSEEMPSLHYRFLCKEGTYRIWLLTKFDVIEESYYGIGIDGQALPKEQLYGEGRLWRYEAEQIWRWTPVAKQKLNAGEHLLSLHVAGYGLRIDRIYITRGDELPPEDMLW